MIIICLQGGKIVSVLVAPVYLWRKTAFSVGSFSVTELKIVAKRYIGFPKYIMWGGFFNTLANYAIQLLIPVFYSINLLGFFEYFNFKFEVIFFYNVFLG